MMKIACVVDEKDTLTFASIFNGNNNLRIIIESDDYVIARKNEPFQVFIPINEIEALRDHLTSILENHAKKSVSSSEQKDL